MEPCLNSTEQTGDIPPAEAAGAGAAGTRPMKFAGLIVFVATVALRLLCLPDFLGSPFYPPFGGDRGLYHNAAVAVYQGSGLPEVFSFLPLYPYLAGWFYRIIGGPNLAAVAILQALLDGLTALLIAGLARRRYGAPAGLFAGLGFAGLGLAAAYSLVTMPVTLGLFWTALTANCVDLWQSRWNHLRSILLGLMLGIGGQILGAFWLMLIPFGIWIVIESCAPLRQRLIILGRKYAKAGQCRQSNGAGVPSPRLPACRLRKATPCHGGQAGSKDICINMHLDGKESNVWLRPLSMGLLVMLCGAACVLPTLAHNVICGRQWIPVTAHGGLNIYMGNNPTSEGYGAVIPGLRLSAEEMTMDSVALASRLSGKPLSPTAADRYWKSQAWNFWRQYPVQALTLLLKKAQRLVSIVDFDDTGVARLLPESVRGLRLTVVGFGLVWLLACAGYGLRPARPGNPGLWIMGACFAAGMLMTFVTARHRLPIALLLLPAAGATLAALAAVVQNARRGINLRWAAGLLGMGLAIAPLTLPDTAFIDDLNRSNRWGQYGNDEKAMVYASRAVFQRRDSPEAWFVLGNAYMAQSNYVSALDAYGRTLQLQPDRTDALFNAGRAREYLGDTGGARILFEQIVELDPRNAKAWFSIAVLKRNAHDREGAQDAISEAANIVGWDHPDIRELLRR